MCPRVISVLLCGLVKLDSGGGLSLLDLRLDTGTVRHETQQAVSTRRETGKGGSE